MTTCIWTFAARQHFSLFRSDQFGHIYWVIWSAFGTLWHVNVFQFDHSAMARVAYQLTCQLVDFSNFENIWITSKSLNTSTGGVITSTSLWSSPSLKLEWGHGLDDIFLITLVFNETISSSQKFNWEGFEWDFSHRWTGVYPSNWLRQSRPIVSLTGRNASSCSRLTEHLPI